MLLIDKHSYALVLWSQKPTPKQFHFHDFNKLQKRVFGIRSQKHVLLETTPWLLFSKEQDNRYQYAKSNHFYLPFFSTNLSNTLRRVYSGKSISSSAIIICKSINILQSIYECSWKWLTFRKKSGPLYQNLINIEVQFFCASSE